MAIHASPALRVPAPGGNDPNTALLLRFEANNNCNTFFDSSVNRNMFQTWGTAAVISTAKSAFGNGSLFLNGSSFIATPDSGLWDCSAVASDIMGGMTQNWTIDYWFNTSANASMAVISRATTTTGWWIGTTTTRKVCVNSNNSFKITSTSQYVVDTWNHVAVVYTGANTTTTLYLNGVSQGTYAGNMQNVPNSYLCIGCLAQTIGNLPYTGYIDELRVSTGIARWTANFTLPARPFDNLLQPANVGGNDQYTKLLIKCDEGWPLSTRDGDWPFYDYSNSNHQCDTQSAGAQAHITSTWTKFGVNAGWFSSANTGIDCKDSDDWLLWNADATIDLWMLSYGWPANNSNMVLVTQNATGTNNEAWYFHLRTSSDGSTISSRFVGSNNTSGSIVLGTANFTSPALYTWYHLACERHGANCNMYINGTLTQSTPTWPVFANISNPLFIGCYGQTSGVAPHSSYFLGGLDEIRISKGIARYQGQNFTPPMIPYDVPVLSTDISDCISGSNPPTGWNKYGQTIAWTATDDASAIGGRAIVPNSAASNDAAIGYTSRQWTGDGEICAIIETGGTTTGTVSQPFVYFRGSTVTGVGLTNGYGVGLMINAGLNSGVRCLAMVNHNVAWLYTPTFLWTANTKYALRVRFQGVIISVKCWQWGTSEPDNWTWEFNETTYQLRNGTVGLSLTNNVRQGQCEWFSFAQGTGSASLPS